jgi:hypothetical protein
VAYFRSNALTVPLLVLWAWAVAGTVITLLASARRQRRQEAELPARAG